MSWTINTFEKEMDFYFHFVMHAWHSAMYDRYYETTFNRQFSFVVDCIKLDKYFIETKKLPQRANTKGQAIC